MTKIMLATALGLFFGFALHRVGATSPQHIINMLRLKDLRLMKTILFAIGLSSVVLFLGLALGFIDVSHISVKSAYVGVLIGGGLLGAGFAIAGLCPGTSLAAAATGRKDAMVFILGGFVGAFAYMLSFDFISQTFLMDKIAGGKVTLAVTGSAKYQALITSVSGTALAIGLGLALMAFAWWLPEETSSKNKTDHKMVPAE